jgi:diguanylate cyclase (GGDEF)-like protein
VVDERAVALIHRCSARTLPSPNAMNNTFNQFDHRMRRVVLVPYLVGVCLILLIANTPAWNSGLNRTVTNVLGLIGLAVSYVQWRFPWHRYPRNAFLVITFGATALIALLVYVGGDDAPFDEYLFLVVVFAPLFYTWRVSLLVAVIVVGVSILPLLYATPDADFVPRQVVRCAALLVTVWMQHLMYHEVVSRERAQQVLEADLAEVCALRDALAQANAQLVEQATTDVLTGVLNHRALITALDTHLIRMQQRKQPCAVLFFDIDHFKAVNDTHGHQAGDQVIAHVAHIACTCLRATDELGRYGGEEFVAVLPSADLNYALQIGERVRAAVAAHPLTLPDDTTICITVSIGVAACHGEDCTQRDLLQAADRALYDAKHSGRNNVRIAALAHA